MELNLYFSGLVLSVCAIHLATVAGQSLQELAHMLGFEQKKLQAQSPARDDWYVFFHCADLLGQDWRDYSAVARKPQQATLRPEKTRIEQRPARLQARM